MSLSKRNLDMAVLVGNVFFGSLFPVSVPFEMIRVSKEGCGYDTLLGPSFRQTLTALLGHVLLAVS